MRAVFLSMLAVGLVAAAGFGQEPEAPSAVLEDLRPRLLKIQAGPVAAAALIEAIGSMIERGHAVAASWWLEFAEERKKAGRLEGGRDHEFVKLRARVTKALAAGDPVLLNKLVLHAENAAANKDGAELVRSIRTLDALLKLAPDTRAQRRVDGLKSRASIKEGSAPAGEATPRTRAGDVLVDQAVARLREGLGIWLKEYEAAGCRVGRKRIQELATATIAIDPKLRVADQLEKLEALTALVEPSRRLTMFLRSRAGMITVFRNGSPMEEANAWAINAWDGPKTQVRVFADDVIQFAFSEPYATNLDGELFLVAACVRLDDRDVPLDSWLRNADEDARKADAKLVRLLPSVKRTAPPDPLPSFSTESIGEAVRKAKAWVLVPSLKSERPCTVPFYEDLVGFEEEFAKGKLPITWLGLEARKFVLALVIPAH